MKHTAHRYFTALCLAFGLAVALSLIAAPAWAGKKKRRAVTPIKSLTMAKAEEEFQAFSAAWVAKVNKQHIKGHSRMEVIKLKNGTWLARYHAVDPKSIKRIVKKTTHPKTPYVGTLKYTEQILENRGKDLKSAKTGQFKPTRGIKVTEIFCRSTNGWQ